ncbi:MAG: hypothetical protein H7Z42_01845 [Roseiflexaceae bacterium]|nr:hypothetical protein [Roseiflexaceae bacterium]
MTWLRTTGLRLLLAIGLAFSIWLYVSVRENPSTRAAFESIPVEVDNLASGLLIVDPNGLPLASRPQITVNAEGAATTIQGLRRTDIRAFADMTGIEPGDYTTPINIVTTRSGLARITFTAEPPLIPFRVEQEITKTVPLEIEVRGTVPFSFEQREAQASVNGRPVTNVIIRGPESRVNQVALGRATADINGLTANYDSPRSVAAFDASGAPVEGVISIPETVNVQVPIVSSIGIKRVPVVPQITGRPGTGQIVADVVVAPEFVTLTGSSGPLDSVSNVVTQPIDLAGDSGTISRTAQLVIPSGVALLDNQPSEVTVRISTVPIAQPFTVALPAEIGATNLPGGLLVSISPNVVQVGLTGNAGAISGIDGTSLRGTVDLSGFTAGVYTLSPTFALPPGVALATQTRVTVSLRAPPAAPTAVPAATPNPAPTENPAPTVSAPPPATDPPTAPPASPEPSPAPAPTP